MGISHSPPSESYDFSQKLQHSVWLAALAERITDQTEFFMTEE